MFIQCTVCAQCTCSAQVLQSLTEELQGKQHKQLHRTFVPMSC